MAHLIGELRLAIPAAFESDEYRNRKNVIQKQFKERQEEAFNELQARAKEQDIDLILYRTRFFGHKFGSCCSVE
jgi:hypothetical protein